MLDLFDLNHSLAGEYLQQFWYPWQALKGIKDLVLSLGKKLGEDYEEVYSNVWIHKTASIAGNAHIGGACIIGPNTQVRHCAFIRGSALVGENCVIGNSTELKNVILFDNVQVPHFNYVGDSILGYKAHMGAGAVTSNVKSDKSLVVVNGIETGLKKFGAMVGDYVEVGCNAVLNPGTVVGRNSNIYPASCVRGVVPEMSIWKTGGVIVKKEDR
jgi:NDP-sugar pyrophosphorylase family protein